jgi:ribonuclease HII
MRRVENKNIKKIFYESYLPKGPVIGPLVVAGVTYKDESLLVENRVRDSKQLSPKRREILAKKIKETAVEYEILAIPAKDIDDMRRVMTLNEIEVNAFAKIVKKLKPDVCYVDSADVKEKRFAEDILAQLSFRPEIISKHKADVKYPIVGAASIIAKTTRDSYVQQIARELELKINLPLGSGYPADPITQEFLRTWFVKYGRLPPYVRKSWKTSQNLVKLKSNKKLDEF